MRSLAYFVRVKGAVGRSDGRSGGMAYMMHRVMGT